MRTVSISGFPEGYETVCQRMLWKGVAYLSEVRPPVEMWTGVKRFTNIIGVLAANGADLKKLEAAIMRGEEGVTGLMHQKVMSHLAYIHQHSVEVWLEELTKHRGAEDCFEWTFEDGCIGYKIT